MSALVWVAAAMVACSYSLLIGLRATRRMLEARLGTAPEPLDTLDVLVVSDGATLASTGGRTGRGAQQPPRPRRRGTRGPLLRAVPECRSDLLVLCDARETPPPEAIRALLAQLVSLGAVRGELHLDSPAPLRPVTEPAQGAAAAS